MKNLYFAVFALASVAFAQSDSHQSADGTGWSQDQIKTAALRNVVDVNVEDPRWIIKEQNCPAKVQAFLDTLVSKDSVQQALRAKLHKVGSGEGYVFHVSAAFAGPKPSAIASLMSFFKTPEERGVTNDVTLSVSLQKFEKLGNVFSPDRGLALPGTELLGHDAPDDSGRSFKTLAPFAIGRECTQAQIGQLEAKLTQALSGP